MDSIDKGFASLLILIIAISSLSLLVIKPSSAQSIPTPSMPEFTVKYVGTASVPLTGFALPAVNITIKNQPFTPYTDRNGNKINLYYLIQWKDNSSSGWQQDELPLTQSNSSYTVLPLALVRSGAPAPSGQVDFQVEAVIGYVTYIQGSVPQGQYIPPTYTGQMSGWSNTQTVTVPKSSSSPSVLTSIFLLLPILFLVFVGVAVLLVVLVVLLIEKKKNR
jgi:hypothetical protein